ncbi:ParB/RepB/Spo0J family partition protein [Flavobacteriaceae bacterium]|nr:ParB/RepB/Spo0J family partition protein [Flavobacteriaceae bacterium]MDB4187198.1 ParB/RepB/Spo0J family partition protein [Flavobacteriaceae bacterium]
MAKSGKKPALGRGLSALLQDPNNDIKSAEDKNADKVVGNVLELAIEQIEVNPFQPRTQFNEDNLKELASSIQELGIIQPITVRKIGFNSFQLVSGERRFRASKMIGLATIPAYVRIANDQESLEMALVENIQRQDLDPIEIGLSYQRLIDEISLTQEQLSQRVGKKRSTIANYMRLLKLDPIVQTGMRDGFLSMGHGRAIINVEKREDQLDLYQKVIKGDLSVRKTEALVKKLKSPPSEKTKVHTPPYLEEGEKEFAAFFDSEVKITFNNEGKGIIHIPFESQQEFSRIKKRLKSEK